MSCWEMRRACLGLSSCRRAVSHTSVVQVDSLTQFTADVLRFTAAETKYFEFLGRSSGGGGHVIATTDATDATVVSNGISSTAAAPAPPPTANGGFSALSKQVAQAREQIASALKNKPCDSKSSSSSGGVAPEDEMALREENIRLRKQLEELQGQVKLLTDRVGTLEIKVSTGGSPAGAGDAKKKAPAPPKDDDDDMDLFGSDDEEDEEAAKIKEQRLAEYAAKKSKKPTLIAKSNVILDVKPWDDETDMKELEKCVRSIVMDGLLWGVSKLVPVGYGINKLQIASVVEDEKVSIDELSDKITEFEDFVQSVDIAAFNKI